MTQQLFALKEIMREALNQLFIFRLPHKDYFIFTSWREKKKESKEEEEALLPACVFYLMVLAGGVMGK